MELAAHGSDAFELYLNGLFYNRLPMQKLATVNGSLKLDLQPHKDPATGECRVTVIFPSHTVGVLDLLCLDDGATLRRHEFDTKILFIGDSITQGASSVYDSLSYAWRVTNMLNAESVIHGIGGGYFHESVFDSIPLDPDTVVIAFGTNDFGHYATYEELRAHARGFLSEIAREYSGKEIFAISPIWRAKNLEKPMGTFDGARDILIEEIKALGIRHIDGMALVPHRTELFADEWLHPNANGFSHYAENLIRLMGKVK
jgi:lysophospholipase L1-like esterase